MLNKNSNLFLILYIEFQTPDYQINMLEQLKKLREIIYAMLRLAESNDESVDSLLDILSELNQKISQLEEESK